MDNLVSVDNYNNFINDDNLIGKGKEVSVYKKNDEVIKIFHDERTSPLERISDEGLILLSQLDLKVFNKPNNLIIKDNKIIGYTEDILNEENISEEQIINSLDDIKSDIYLLSEYGFTIDDLYYNYMGYGDYIKFTDMTSFKYIKTDVEFLKKKILLKNIETINTFLIGYLKFDAFRKGEKNEYTKIYQAYTFNKENCESLFYGDYLKEMKQL